VLREPGHRDVAVAVDEFQRRGGDLDPVEQGDARSSRNEPPVPMM
jgi:hypothetical protein